MRLKIIFVKILFMIQSVLSEYEFDNDASSMREACLTAGLVMQNCWRKVSRDASGVNAMSGFISCLKKKSLILLDALLEQDELELPMNVRLVKTEHLENDTRKIITRENSKYQATTDNSDWETQVLYKLRYILRTHSLKIPMSKPTNTAEARKRRRDNIMPLILFGIMAMTIISIPLGFQFLAVLGGKSLLLAKLALILTSIQGLKKIATSNLNYGLYHTHRNDYKPWLYDRRGQPPIPDHHGYQGFDVPDQREEALYHHLSPRISNFHQTN